MIKAFVLGSLNIDLVLSLDHIVQPSETCNVNGTQEFLGGKGANQAVALALASSSNVYLIANVGRKDFNRLTDELKGFGVVPILTLDELTGQAIIQVEKSGENAILLIPNANMSWDLETIYQELLNHNISRGDYILLQNEVSLNVIQNVLKRLDDLKPKIVLNPAPCTPEILCDDILQHVAILILNRIEAQQLAIVKGIRVGEPSEMALDIFRSLSCSIVIITLGGNGLVLAFKEDFESDPKILEFKALEGIQPIDSTGAGDCFTGYFVGSLLKHGVLPQVWNDEALSNILISSIRMGIAASGMSTLKKGAILSYPERRIVEEKIKSIWE